MTSIVSIGITNMVRFTLAAALVLTAVGSSHAQQEIEWTQTLNTPKGANMPRESADMLGIELGDTYAEAKAKLLKLLEEDVTPKPASKPSSFHTPRYQEPKREPLTEAKTRFTVQSPGTLLVLNATFVKQLELERKLKGTADATPILESIKVTLSAPSSGHQVIGIERNINYRVESDQPRVSEVLGQLGRKLKAEPLVSGSDNRAEYLFRFQNAKAVPPNAPNTLCSPSHHEGSAANLSMINGNRNCAAVLKMAVTFGISRDHAKSLQFILSDNERTKTNLVSDFAFVEDYLRKLGERTRGAPPKL